LTSRPASMFGRSALPNIWNPSDVTDAERLNDIAKKLCSWGYVSRCRDAERDMAWLLEKLGERNARIAELEARLRQHEWIFLLP
jgi:hypothetical protein